MKLEQIIVMSKEKILDILNMDVKKLMGIGILSISSKFEDEIYFKGLERRGLILKLAFHDIDTINNGNGLRAITKEQSNLIIDYVNFIKDHVDTLICQCENGISRSSGIAAAISKFLFDSDEYYFEHYNPNVYVYRMILNSFYNYNKETIYASNVDRATMSCL